MLLNAPNSSPVPLVSFQTGRPPRRLCRGPSPITDYKHLRPAAESWPPGRGRVGGPLLPGTAHSSPGGPGPAIRELEAGWDVPSAFLPALPRGPALDFYRGPLKPARVLSAPGRARTGDSEGSRGAGAPPGIVCERARDSASRTNRLAAAGSVRARVPSPCRLINPEITTASRPNLRQAEIMISAPC